MILVKIIKPIHLMTEVTSVLGFIIKSWNEPLEVLKEVNVGYRFVSTPRKLDIVIRNTQNNRYLGIECKLQLTTGSAYEKFSYALDDCLTSPIPTILVFAGNEIKNDMKSKLIMSGAGIEVEYYEKNNAFYFEDTKNLMKQRCYIELGLDWFPFATGDLMPQQLEELFVLREKNAKSIENLEKIIRE